VTVTFEEHDGRTLFTLRQSGFQSQEVRDACNSHALVSSTASGGLSPRSWAIAKGGEADEPSARAP
jgi:hypothetical protein